MYGRFFLTRRALIPGGAVRGIQEAIHPGMGVAFPIGMKRRKAEVPPHHYASILLQCPHIEDSILETNRMMSKGRKGWERESEDLFIHESGARISKTTYRGKRAWWFFPVSLDTLAVEHAPTDVGREDAFATSVKEVVNVEAQVEGTFWKENSRHHQGQ